MKIKDIWIEAEQWAEGELDPFNDNSDVIVTFEDDSRWVATFVTFKNITTLTEKNRKTGECLSGSYLWASDMILIDAIDQDKIKTVINDLITSGEFENAFSKCSEN
jgi:hypothetical protein